MPPLLPPTHPSPAPPPNPLHIIGLHPGPRARTTLFIHPPNPPHPTHPPCSPRTCTAVCPHPLPLGASFECAHHQSSRSGRGAGQPRTHACSLEVSGCQLRMQAGPLEEAATHACMLTRGGSHACMQAHQRWQPRMHAGSLGVTAMHACLLTRGGSHACMQAH